MPRNRKRPIESVHQRTQRELREARARPKPVAEQSKTVTPPENGEAAIQRPVESTFNWRDESLSPFVPNLVQDGEMESLRREFINSVASGESHSELDEQAMRDPQQFFEDTIEGIRRWHTYGKER